MIPDDNWLEEWQLERDYYNNESIYHCKVESEMDQLIKDSKSEKEDNGGETRSDNNKS